MLKLFYTSLVSRGRAEGKKTIKAHHALFTAMSTTIGISTIVSPVIAIRMGGPGAVLGFVLVTVLGAAVNFTEVTFALSYRKSHPEKGVSGGPMQYLKAEIHPLLAKGYAFFGVLLLMGWSAAQSNQLSEIFASPLLGSFAIPEWVTGLCSGGSSPDSPSRRDQEGRFVFFQACPDHVSPLFERLFLDSFCQFGQNSRNFAYDLSLFSPSKRVWGWRNGWRSCSSASVGSFQRDAIE